MEIKSIVSEKDYKQALERFEIILEAELNTQEGNEPKSLSILIEKYEDIHYPI
ncbi:MAG: hypothetical protein H7098_09715 [Oligoflexus sp.]|nr:hypothetical protein [Pseudopedobacter sp.]